MKKFVAPGDSVQVTAPYAVVPGDGMLIGSLFCVSTKKAALGESTDAVTEGQIDLPAVSSETAAEGVVAYWDTVNKRVSVGGGVAIGTLPNGKLAGVAEARVRLGAPSLVSGGRKTRGAARIVGGTTTSAGQTTNAAYLIKFEAEGPFTAFRFKIHGRDTAASLTWKAVAAVTASASQASDSLMFYPTVDGINFITTLAASGNPNGWRPAAWAGAATTDVSAGSSFLPGETPWSDWIPAASIDRVDGGVLPLGMLRLYHDGTSQPFTVLSGGFGLTQWNSQTAKDYYRVWQVGAVVGTDAVTSLTTKPGSLAGSGPWISIEFLYSAPRVRSLLGIGDSRMEANAGQLPNNVLGAWGMRGCHRASTPTRPISWMNCGYSNKDSTTYLEAGLAAITSLDPTDVLYDLWSPNDGTGEKFLSDAAMARAMRVVDVCSASNRRLFLSTPLPDESQTLAGDNERKRCITLIRNLCSSGFATLVDYGTAMGNGATPELFIPSYRLDVKHVNDAGHDVGGNLLRDALLATW